MRLFIFILTMITSSLAIAGDNADAGKDVTKKIQAAFPTITVDGVRKAPVSGLYVIQAGKGVFYSDLNGEHVIFGAQIIELATKRNLTQERMIELSRIDWNILPLDKAIVSGDEHAKLKVAVFTDPDCPYCKQLEAELKHATGIKIYTFLLPLSSLHPGARAKAEAIWCSKNQHATMLKVILDGATLKKAKCDTPLDDIAALAKKIGINGTPTLIAGDGRVSPGVKMADDLKVWLLNNKHHN